MWDKYNFSRNEFACACGCGFDAVDYELLEVLQTMRNHFETEYSAPVKVTITGGNRCVEHNETIQKKYNHNYVPYSSNSQHTKGMAADCKVFVFIDRLHTWKPVPAWEMYEYLNTKYPTSYGLGRYDNRVHIDVRADKARWDSR